jgi:outer membrane protein assembly factor BamB
LLSIISAPLQAQPRIASEPRTTEAPLSPLPLFPVRRVWTLPLNNALTAPAGFGANRGYFPIEGSRLAAYDLLLGQLLWVKPAEPVSAPVAGESLVFIAEKDAIVALDRDAGEVAWRVPTESPTNIKEDELRAFRRATPLVWQDGWLLATDPDGTMFAYRAVDGALIWSRQLGIRSNAAPTVAADRVYVPTVDGRLFALRADTGEPVWERQLGSGALHEVLALDDRLYVGSNDNHLYCLRTRDGRFDWRWPTGADVIGRPIADSSRIYFVSLDNVLRALDRGSGAQRWKSELDLRPRWGPLWAGETILVSGLAPTVIGYRVTDGTAIGGEKLAGDLAALYVLEGTIVPTFVAVILDIAKGDTVFAFSRVIDPPSTPVSPLPNVARPAPLPPDPGQ